MMPHALQKAHILMAAVGLSISSAQRKMDSAESVLQRCAILVFKVSAPTLRIWTPCLWHCCRTMAMHTCSSAGSLPFVEQPHAGGWHKVLLYVVSRELVSMSVAGSCSVRPCVKLRSRSARCVATWSNGGDTCTSIQRLQDRTQNACEVMTTAGSWLHGSVLRTLRMWYCEVASAANCSLVGMRTCLPPAQMLQSCSRGDYTWRGPWTASQQCSCCSNEHSCPARRQVLDHQLPRYSDQNNAPTADRD